MSNSERATEQWLETRFEAGDATGPATASLLETLASTLRDAPESKRYDINLTIEERDIR